MEERIFRETNQGRLAIIVYTILGFPDVVMSLEALEMLREHEITVYETAIPIATGHAPELSQSIKNAHKIACLNGVTSEDVFKVYLDYRPNLCVIHEGTQFQSLQDLVEEMRGSIDSVLLGWDEKEIKKYRKIAGNCGIDMVLSVSPEMSPEEMRQNVEHADGLVYLTAAPQTGGKLYPRDKISQAIKTIKSIRNDIPICCGFGIRTAQDVIDIGSLEGCNGIIIGTAILDSLSRGLTELCEYLDTIIAAAGEAKRK